MKIGICNDHRGFYVKNVLIEYLEHQGFSVVDYGSDGDESVDFPKYAIRLGDAIRKGRVDYGIAICGTGIGMSIALNKVRGVYCARVCSINDAVLCRQHNNANCISFSADLDIELTEAMVLKFLSVSFLNEDKYVRRNKMIEDQEDNV